MKGKKNINKEDRKKESEMNDLDRSKKPKVKEGKYRHMQHWLEDDDDDYVPPNLRDEEE